MTKVYDKVWIMDNNVPTEMLVYAIVEEISRFAGGVCCLEFLKRGTDTTYRLVYSICDFSRATFNNSKKVSIVYPTKQALIESLEDK